MQLLVILILGRIVYSMAADDDTIKDSLLLRCSLVSKCRPMLDHFPSKSCVLDSDDTVCSKKRVYIARFYPKPGPGYADSTTTLAYFNEEQGRFLSMNVTKRFSRWGAFTMDRSACTIYAFNDLVLGLVIYDMYQADWKMFTPFVNGGTRFRVRFISLDERRQLVVYAYAGDYPDDKTIHIWTNDKDSHDNREKKTWNSDSFGALRSSCVDHVEGRIYFMKNNFQMYSLDYVNGYSPFVSAYNSSSRVSHIACGSDPELLYMIDERVRFRILTVHISNM